MDVKAKCVRPFRDLQTGGMRAVGEEFETTDGRVSEINAAGYGVLVEIVGGDRPSGDAAQAEERPKPKRRATTRRRTAKTKETKE